MDEEKLKASIKTQIISATGYLGGQITEDRRKAMRDYLGEPLGNEVDGRSQVISTDVQDVVEAVMPDLIQIFTSSDKSVRFDPKGQEDEGFADQATDYVNHIWNVDNDGFGIFHDWFKDALLQINGIIKIWWDDTEKKSRTQYQNLTDDQLAYLLTADGVEVLEHTEKLDPDDEEALEEAGIVEGMEEYEAASRLHDVTILRTRPGGRVNVQNVPPEEFLISRRARCLDDAPFLAHWVHHTYSELVEMGYDPEQLDGIPSDDEQEFNEERVTRFNRDDEWPFQERATDETMRSIRVYECYIRADWDNDNVAELLKVRVAGRGYDVLKFTDGKLDIEPVDDHPFAAITPIRMPHKFFGRSLAELVQDIQYIKTSIWRQLLDNMYNVNNARAAISNKVSLEDYLDNRVAAPIRVDTNSNDVGGHIMPVPTTPIGNHAYPALEYIDQVRELRTGVARISQGLDPDALNSTARGINMILGRTQQRTLLIAQVFANGVRDAFLKILKLTITHQDKPRMVRLRNKWVEIDPRFWNAEMDVTVNVGLGRGTQDQRIASMNMLQMQMDRLVALQGGVNGPLVTWEHIKNAYDEFLEAIGLKSPDPYAKDITPEEAQKIAQQPPPPDPKVVEAEGKLKLAQADQQGKHQLALREGQMKHIRELQALGLKKEADEAKLELDAMIANAKNELERDKATEQAKTQRLAAAQRGNGQG
jgi:hypothetical protein